MVLLEILCLSLPLEFITERIYDGRTVRFARNHFMGRGLRPEEQTWCLYSSVALLAVDREESDVDVNNVNTYLQNVIIILIYDFFVSSSPYIGGNTICLLEPQ